MNSLQRVFLLNRVFDVVADMVKLGKPFTAYDINEQMVKIAQDEKFEFPFTSKDVEDIVFSFYRDDKFEGMRGEKEYTSFILDIDLIKNGVSILTSTAAYGVADVGDKHDLDLAYFKTCTTTIVDVSYVPEQKEDLKIDSDVVLDMDSNIDSSVFVGDEFFERMDTAADKEFKYVSNDIDEHCQHITDKIDERCSTTPAPNFVCVDVDTKEEKAENKEEVDNNFSTAFEYISNIKTAATTIVDNIFNLSVLTTINVIDRLSKINKG